MNTLIGFVILYWVISVGIGLYAARFVKNSKDYAVAGRSLPMYVVTATVFATWFGSEAVLGISSTFLKEGLRGVVADPFGSSLCLVLVGLFFAKPLYRMNLLTIGDYYRNKFGRSVEVLVTLCIVVSYLGWVAAQIKALGLVFNVVSDGYIEMNVGMVIGAASVLIYTLKGGMWSVAITDFLQMIIIVVGMIYIGWEVSGMVGGAGTVIAHAANAGKFEFWPAPNARDMLWFFAAWITMMLGSIPQQDVFQRVASSKNETIAGHASILGGVLYFCFAFIPMFLAYSATLIDPEMVNRLIDKDSQLILPTLIMNKVPMLAQVMFFGALLSAIKSCASATLLAPSVTFTENILKPFFPEQSDRQFLRMMRIVVLLFTVIVTIFAMHTESSIYKMVENAYKVTLVAAFVPLAFGLYWKPATAQGGLASIVCGLVSWVALEMLYPEGFWPPQLVGVVMSMAGMLVGSLLPQFSRKAALI
ncbi:MULTISPECIES: sodium:solute symporter family protein [unclassified Undibacterium]|uniref:sodium:solute symporter family protein n=1 Tax=unclassified Undibacterium TaxID=2630295 RepID=UPI002AC9BE1D|nr:MULTISPECIES: sodium:solute symporter family protein [unclassified Undibacterium]MEB0138627.1 sodium:solute symporter family protein [Undibacterium sp. CCC2.1]MEB0171428.1 sodium:solute symporter family protein [Undibacterium sp. CCC1.1]MEB0175758.1 sodium:solute symporter family protein [Undibacterium sp. CCC3.4]MEB0214414.1 sodium:solute symporter family protein [Undibacterium sp. 5I2]WPX44279.1 sodium:solute symporter family protein [Undibacterium sp. CCC3.4]